MYPDSLIAKVSIELHWKSHDSMAALRHFRIVANVLQPTPGSPLTLGGSKGNGGRWPGSRLTKLNSFFANGNPATKTNKDSFSAETVKIGFGRGL